MFYNIWGIWNTSFHDNILPVSDFLQEGVASLGGFLLALGTITIITADTGESRGLSAQRLLVMQSRGGFASAIGDPQ